MPVSQPMMQDAGLLPYVQQPLAPYPPYQQALPPQRLPGRVQSVGELPHDGAHFLGLSVLAVGTLSATGFAYGGVGGSFAGGMLGGALVNLIRAYSYATGHKEDPNRGKEAVVSGTYAILAAGASAYLWYKFSSDKQQMLKNASETDCDIRRAGP